MAIRKIAEFLTLGVNPDQAKSSIVIAEETTDSVEDALATTLIPAVEPRTEAISDEQFDALVRQHQRRVYRVLLLLVRDGDAADTLTQECFLRAYRTRASFRGECSVSTWLLRIAVNLARDHAKNRRVSFWRRLVGFHEPQDGSAPAETVASGQASAERVLLAREKLHAVWNATAMLSPQQRNVFLLRFAEEMSLAEIAELLQLEIGSVKAQLFRATNKIKQHLKESYAVHGKAQ